MSKVRIALVGAGVIGKRHLAAMADVHHVELVGIADPSEAVKVVAAKHGVPYYLLTEQLLNSTQPDGVIIATPTAQHFEPTMIALDNGAHVLVEKPVMATMEESQCIVEKSHSVKKHVLVGHHRRYYGLVNQARDIVQGGQIGNLIAVSGQWTLRKHVDYYDPGWRKAWQAGPILTNLIHDMDLLRYVAGNLVSISAETSNAAMGYEKEDAAVLSLRFKNGALGSFILSDQTHTPWGWEQATGENAAVPYSGQNAMRFMGTDGALEFPHLKLWSSKGTADWHNALDVEDISERLEDAFISQISHFANVISGTESPRITARDATETLRATLAVYDSAETGCRVLL